MAVEIGCLRKHIWYFFKGNLAQKDHFFLMKSYTMVIDVLSRPQMIQIASADSVLVSILPPIMATWLEFNAIAEEWKENTSDGSSGPVNWKLELENFAKFT